MRHILQDLKLDNLMDSPTTIYNDNTGCVEWSNNLTNRNLRHLQMRENAIRENVQRKCIEIIHCDGSNNVSDIFTKEDKDKEHFIRMRNCIVVDPIFDDNEYAQTDGKDIDSPHFSMDRGVLTHYPLSQTNKEIVSNP